MLLIDLSSIVVRGVVGYTPDNPDGIDLDLNVVRHVTASAILYYKQKYNKYGTPILCIDSNKGYWRHDVFPHYKQNRVKPKKSSDFDWKKYYKLFLTVKEELRTHFPYWYMDIDKAEADDVIAVLAKESGQNEKVMIVSSDKDMLQLQAKYGKRIHQYSPHTKKELTVSEKEYNLIEHIVRGDVSDGVPNILSDPDVFVCAEKKQVRLYAKAINAAMELDLPKLHWPDLDVQANYDRNEILIDTSRIPDYLVSNIVNAWDAQKDKRPPNKLYQYFVRNKMRILAKRINDF